MEGGEGAEDECELGQLLFYLTAAQLKHIQQQPPTPGDEDWKISQVLVIFMESGMVCVVEYIRIFLYIYIHVYNIMQMVPVVSTVKWDVRGLTIIHDVATNQHITQGGLLTVMQLQHQFLSSHAVPPGPPDCGTERAEGAGAGPGSHAVPPGPPESGTEEAKGAPGPA